MGLIATLHDWTDGDVLTSADLEGALAAIRDVVNTYGVLTDTARTITVTNTHTLTQTFTGGWTAGAACTISTGGLTVSAGTTAVQALTATTGVFSSTLGVSGAATFVTVTASSVIKSLAGAVDVRFYADSGLGQGVLGTFSAHDFALVTNSINRLVITSGGAFTLTGTLTVSSTLTTQANFVASGTATISGAINGQTISSAAAFTGSLTVATTLGVTGATTLAALTCTTLHPSGLITADDGLTFTAASPVITLASGATLAIKDHSGNAIATFGELVGTTVLNANGTGIVRIGTGGTLVSTTTVGFLEVPLVSGTPTGTASAGALLWDAGTLKLWIKGASAWKSVTLA